MHQCLNLKIGRSVCPRKLGNIFATGLPASVREVRTRTCALGCRNKIRTIVQRLYNPFHQQFRQKSRALPQFLNLYLGSSMTGCPSLQNHFMLGNFNFLILATIR